MRTPCLDLFSFIKLFVRMLHELFCLIAEAVPIWLFFDELMKVIGDVKFVVEAVGRNGKRFAAGCDFAKGCAAARAEATVVLVGRFGLVR